ncbi:HTH_XRE domain containing protein [uncultured Caudovirales phage]|uniref:HTH_XRE domain containing protein n=1 Tax=uncultured Caudovirales phage TaxID=2100421 RepID=A0A6J5KLG9_9CAUD|nr:HTH_XRE domain containing protein [uncultured Caudovirales phage]
MVTPTSKGELELQIGTAFSEVRRKHNFWLRNLAAELGVCVNTIRWHESGARMMRADIVVKAAQIMGVKVGTLLGQDKEMNADGSITEQSLPNGKRRTRPRSQIV